MKFIKKRFVLCSIMFIVFMSINVYAEEKGNGGIEYSECIPAGVDEYIRENYTDLLSTVVQLDNYNGEALESYKLGLPFVIYNVGTYEQDEIYYYTVLDDSNNVRYIIDVIVTSDGDSIEISNEWVDVIKNIDNINKTIFLMFDDRLYVEDDNSNSLNFDYIIYNLFEKKNFYAKCSVIKNAVKRFRIVNLDDNCENIDKAKYTPEFSVNTSTNVVCSLHNKQYQGLHGLCWAASVATIVNYRRGKCITAIQVADKMEIGYDDGGTPSEARSALNAYNVSYMCLLTNVMSWSKYKTNIDNKYPVYVHGKKSGENVYHAVVFYGYMISGNTKYLVYWDPASHTSKSSLFQTSGTVFTNSNGAYTWKKSVSMS